MKHLDKLAQQETAQQRRTLTHNVQVTNSPHQAGTVSELAEKLGVSKSEVRRLKREGRLELELNRL